MRKKQHGRVHASAVCVNQPEPAEKKYRLCCKLQVLGVCHWVCTNNHCLASDVLMFDVETEGDTPTNQQLEAKAQAVVSYIVYGTKYQVLVLPCFSFLFPPRPLCRYLSRLRVASSERQLPVSLGVCALLLVAAFALLVFCALGCDRLLCVLSPPSFLPFQLHQYTYRSGSVRSDSSSQRNTTAVQQ